MRFRWLLLRGSPATACALIRCRSRSQPSALSRSCRTSRASLGCRTASTAGMPERGEVGDVRLLFSRLSHPVPRPHVPEIATKSSSAEISASVNLPPPVHRVSLADAARRRAHVESGVIRVLGGYEGSPKNGEAP